MATINNLRYQVYSLKVNDNLDKPITTPILTKEVANKYFNDCAQCAIVSIDEHGSIVEIIEKNTEPIKVNNNYKTKNMKSYTDLEQSKKLAEFLPLESADMFHFIHEVDTVGFGYKKDAEEFYSKTEFEYIPCWSFVALLSVLPNGIVMNKDSQNGRYHFSSKYIGTYVTADNPIDACYELILKLHELNLL